MTEEHILRSAILYEDDDLLVINKPPDWVVNRSHTYPHETVQDWIEQYSPQPRVNSPEPTEEDTIFLERSGLAHRLDKDTSGVLVIAKNPEALTELLRQFREREVSKSYLALTHGKVTPLAGTIKLPLGRHQKNRLKFAVHAGGRPSETMYEVKEYFPHIPSVISVKKGKTYQGFTLLSVRPKTGRTHQIRVHLSAINHPIVCDETYTGKHRYQIDHQWCPRQFLHAHTIEFTHPKTRARMKIEAPLPQDLEAILSMLRES